MDVFSDLMKAGTISEAIFKDSVLRLVELESLTGLRRMVGTIFYIRRVKATMTKVLKVDGAMLPRSNSTRMSQTVIVVDNSFLFLTFCIYLCVVGGIFMSLCTRIL